MSASQRLPAETIKQIFFFALGGDLPLATPFTCEESITPPVGTSSLLLVSKDLAAYSLPFYWRSVTILDSYDWAGLWAPETGLFAGERGQERASIVREIRINTAIQAAMPVDVTRIANLSPRDRAPATYLETLEAVPISNLRHVCFFMAGREAGCEDEDYADYPGDEDVLELERNLEDRADQDRYWDEAEAELQCSMDSWHSLSKVKKERLISDEVYKMQSRDPPERSSDRELLQPLEGERVEVLIQLLGPSTARPLQVHFSDRSDAAAGLFSHLHRACDQLRAKVHASFEDLEEFSHSIRFIELDGKAPYDLIGYSPEARKVMESSWRWIQGRNNWRWVNEDGSHSPFGQSLDSH